MATLTRHTHRQKMEQHQADVRERFCRLLHISEDTYYNMHYELAYKWFEFHGYPENVARSYLLSKGYHNWWDHTLMMFEENIMRNYHGTKAKEHYIEMVLRSTIRPGRNLSEQFLKEGYKILKANS